MKGNWDFMEKVSLVASLGSLLFSVAALSITKNGTDASLQLERETIALNLLSDYMKLAIEHPEYSNRPDTLHVGGRYEWFASQAYADAEGIHNVAHGKPSWDSSVAAIVRYHGVLVREGAYDCHDYSSSFDSVVRRELKSGYKCSQYEGKDSVPTSPIK